MRQLPMRPTPAALVALALLAPLLLLNAIVENRVEPFFSALRPGNESAPREYVAISVALLLLPIGAWLALVPLLPGGSGSRGRFSPLNAAVAALLLIVFAAIGIGFASDIYRCDVLRVPNCD